MISGERRANNANRAITNGLIALHIPVPLTTVQWADEYYYLPKESSYTPGKWETLPFQVAIMNAMGYELIRVVNLIKSARVGYTKMLLGVEGYFIEHKSRNSLLFQPTDSSAEDFMKSHVEPTIRDVPVLLELAPRFGRKHRDNTLTLKRFSSGVGFWCLGGAAAKTTVKNRWMWSAMTNCHLLSRMSRKKVRRRCWGINVLKVLSGLNPFGAPHQKSKGHARLKRRQMNRRILCVLCTVSALWRRTVP